jgi:uncharacterized protein (DUF1786 family)
VTHRRILAIDVGVGTTDILVFDPGQPPESSVKLVVPSRTQVVAGQIHAATGRRLPVVFHGPTMGGGPSTAAMREHLQVGLTFRATRSAALTFADNLERVSDHGVHLIADDEVAGALHDGCLEVRSADVDLPELLDVLTRLGVDAAFSAGCLAVQDHGFEPRGSNRVFRFELWRQALADRRPLEALFYEGGEIPAELTRLRSAAASLAALPRVLVADTAPAALLGALPESVDDAVLVNVGNGHTVCAVTLDRRLAGVLEHHTRLLDGPAVESLLRRFLAGEVTDDEVREGGGHGAALGGPVPAALPIFVTGPRRALLAESSLELSYPAPFGDMMMTGPVGLVRAYCRRHGLTVPD